MKKLLLGQTSSSDEDYNGDCDVVVVELDEEVAKVMLARMKLRDEFQKKDSDLNDAYFWDDHATYYRVTDWEAFEDMLTSWKEADNSTMLDVFFDHDWVELPEGTTIDKLPISEERTECDQMVVLYDGDVKFTAIPKHTSIYVESPRISREELQEFT